MQRFQNRNNSVRITFPSSAKSMSQLDSWLAGNPSCKCVLLDGNHIGRRDFNRLMKIKDVRGVVVAVSPKNRSGAQC